MTLAGLHAVVASDAAKLATMRAALGDLITSAPDGNRRMVLSRLTTPMAELHGAIDVIALSADPSTEPAGVPVTQLAAQLHTTAASVRADLALQR
jgi:hypothetical protein